MHWVDLSYELFDYFFHALSWTCVYAYPLAIALILLIGGSSVPKTYKRRPRAKYFRNDGQGNLVDEVELRRRKNKEKRMAEQAKRTRKGVSKRKGKEPKINYRTLDAVTFSSIHHRDLFAELPRDDELGDTRFWCA